MYTLASVKAVTFSMAPERSAKKLCNTEPVSAVGVQTFKHRAMIMVMIVTMSLCALWGMPPGMAVACGWAPYFCAWSFGPAMNHNGTLHSASRHRPWIWQVPKARESSMESTQ